MAHVVNLGVKRKQKIERMKKASKSIVVENMMGVLDQMLKGVPTEDEHFSGMIQSENFEYGVAMVLSQVKNRENALSFEELLVSQNVMFMEIDGATHTDPLKLTAHAFNLLIVDLLNSDILSVGLVRYISAIDRLLLNTERRMIILSMDGEYEGRPVYGLTYNLEDDDGNIVMFVLNIAHPDIRVNS